MILARLALTISLALASLPVAAQVPSPQRSPGARALGEMFDFLLGAWEGEGNGEPGESTGRFVFEASLDGNLVTRRSRADYQATKDGPPVTREDVTAVYAEAGQVRADYFDNEGRVIHYTVSYEQESGTVTFLSPILEGKARYRLTYRPLSKDRVEVVLEIAPPDKPTAFTAYAKGRARRIGGGR